VQTVCSWLFFGIIVAGLIGDSSSLWAQPANDSAATGRDERAPGGDESAPSADAPTSSADTPASSVDTPAPSAVTPAPSAGQPASPGNAPITSAATIAINAPDEPWSRGVSVENRMAARALFLEGNRLFKIPLFARAAEQYIAALSKWKHPAIYLNLAIAQLIAGQEVEAYTSLERALQYGEKPLGAETFRGAQLQRAEIKRQLGRIRVTCRTQGAQVTLDGVLLFIGPGSYEGWVKAKDHEITARKPKYLSEARRVTVASGQNQDVELKLITLREAAEASRRWKAWKPWVVFAAGGAITAIGGTFHTLSFREFENYDRKFLLLPCANRAPGGCLKNDHDLEQYGLNDQLQLARRERVIALGTYVVGGSLLTASLVLLYLNRPRLAERILEDSSSRNVTVIPAVSGDMFGILVDVIH